MFKRPSKQTKQLGVQRSAGCPGTADRQTSLSPQFLRRQQVLQLYRRILRAIRDVPAEADRCYLKDWAREEFRRNKDATDEVRTGNTHACPKEWSVRYTVLVTGFWVVGVTSRLVRVHL